MTLNSIQYIPIGEVRKPNLTTDEAAFYLNRRPQTLRLWACRESSELRPIRVNGRLAWRLSDVKSLVGAA
jgi:hypothetical protein